MTDSRAARILISGRVQMVGFRYFSVKHAQKYNIGGYVRNLPDGRVEIEAVGPKNAFSDFLNEIRRGPPSARVEDIDVRPLDPEQLNYTGFEISY